MDELQDKERAPRNRTITLSDEERDRYSRRLLRLVHPVAKEILTNATINQDLFVVLDHLPTRFVDLLFIDPPYNLTKDFGSASFKEMTTEEYASWFSLWFPRLLRLLKPTASVYICSDWRSSGVVQTIAEKHLVIQNRITWEREKGRGAKSNWKNCSEDVWFCTMSNSYYFNADAVKLKRRVIAPYKDTNGKPKDWKKTQNGDFRLTCPSNLWTDLTIPFWSMPENTDHSTQKPEKLLAKIVLASSREGDFVFDPFMGSGTTSVVAKKLGRRYCGVELDMNYCCLAEKRLAMAESDASIQGYSDGVFWERNTLAYQNATARNGSSADQMSLCFHEGRGKYEE
ncbi:MAG TPA: site-specific DNA-methyltransferase [Sedimentisphaerales bacterium]|nr:site-specific DNA-methyltransferase [Sedimentisphaerales bacterium]